MSSYSEGQTHQLVESLEAAGYTPAQITKMGQSRGLLVQFRRVLEGIAEITQKEVAVPPLLELLSTSVVSATNELFVADKKFMLKGNGGIYSYLGENFTNWFLDKVEDPMSKTTLHGYKLKQNSLDVAIIKEQGGEAKAETTLTEVYSLMEKQPNSEDGVLLTNGWANIFYVHDTNATLRVVFVRWRDDGWDVSSHEVSSPPGWRAGAQVFSHNSVLVSSVSQVAALS